MTSKELEALEKLNHTICLNYNNKTLKFGVDTEEHIDCDNVNEFVDCYNTIKSALERKEFLEYAIKDLFANHIEFVVEKDKCYFKIRNSKGKEKSFTSKTFEDFWKEMLIKVGN